jgi:hypothetical protein
MWRVTIPSVLSPAAERWLESLGFDLVEAAWKIRIASLPAAINNSQVPIFATRQPIIASFRAPSAGARTDVTLANSSSRATESVRTVSPSDTAFVTFSVPWPGSNELRAGYDDRSSIVFETDNAEDLWELKDAVKAVPALELSIGDVVVRAWDDPFEIPMPRRSEEQPKIVVSPDLDDLRFDLSWDGAQSSGNDESISPEILARRLAALIEAGASVSVEVDGAGLGKLRFALRRAEKQNAIASTVAARRISFLAGALRSPVAATTPMSAWLRRRACAINRGVAYSGAKGLDPRWAGLLAKTLKRGSLT